MDYQYKGMTVNERLYASGLMAEFDKSVSMKDIESVINILNHVEIRDETAVELILKKLGLKK